MVMTEHAVVVVGAGPTGMTLAAELALAEVEVVVVERRPTPELPGSRSGGLQARTIEVYDQRGVAERFLEAGTTAQVNAYAGTTLDLGDFPTRHPYGLALWQDRFEPLLAAWLDELGVTVLRGREVTGAQQDDDGVDLSLAGGDVVRGRYVVACDGGRSLIRRAAGIAFPGWEATSSTLIAEVRLVDPEMGMKRDARGVNGIGPTGDPDYVRVVAREAAVQTGAEPTLAQLREAMLAIWGSDFAVHDPRWLSRFSDAARQAETYRAGRVLVAGDAAHIHSPVGGQGLNTGVQDAVNLGWKLAQVVHGHAPDALLDTYHRERHPIGAAVLQHTLAQTVTMPETPGVVALRADLARMLAHDGPRRELAGQLSGLALRYDLGDGHPLLGRRVPDLDLLVGAGQQRPRRLFTLLHEARPLLLDLGTPGALDAVAAPWAARVHVVDATYDGPWELPVLGAVEAPGAVLVRPDGYVAWTGAPGETGGLTDALTTWFGPAE